MKLAASGFLGSDLPNTNRLCVSTTFSFPRHTRDETKKKDMSRHVVNMGSDFTLLGRQADCQGQSALC